MKHKRAFVIAAFCLLVCRTAAAQKVSVDWDTSVNFSTSKTYAYLEGSHTESVDGPADRQRHRAATDAEGSAKVDVNANPDLIVSYPAAAGSRTQVNTTGTGGWGWGYRWGGRNVNQPACSRSRSATPNPPNYCGLATPATP